MATTLDMEKLPVRSQSLYQPPQIELAVGEYWVSSIESFRSVGPSPAGY